MMSRLLMVIALALLTVSGFSQDGKKSKTSIAVITSNIVCGMCEDNLDNMFRDFYAVRAVDYDIPNQEIIVTYNNKKTSIEEIEKRISDVGYQANEVMPNEAARKKLNECCKGDICEVGGEM